MCFLSLENSRYMKHSIDCKGLNIKRKGQKLFVPKYLAFLLMIVEIQLVVFKKPLLTKRALLLPEIKLLVFKIK